MSRAPFDRTSLGRPDQRHALLLLLPASTPLQTITGHVKAPFDRIPLGRPDQRHALLLLLLLLPFIILADHHWSFQGAL
jgi:hypothetical protein